MILSQASGGGLAAGRSDGTLATGRGLAGATADRRTGHTGDEVVRVCVNKASDATGAVAAVTPYPKGDPAVGQNPRRITGSGSGGARVLADVIRELDSRSIVIHDIGLRRPTLDDVFLALTGHATMGDENEADGADGETAADSADSADEAREESR